MGFSILSALAVLGFLASVACHVMGWLRLEPSWASRTFLLHVGIFAFWFPLVYWANKTKPTPGRDNAAHLLAELPKWVRIALGVLFAYAFVHFGLFIYATRSYPRHGVPVWLKIRGFSGHWMLFYAAAAAGFAGLARLSRKREEQEGLA